MPKAAALSTRARWSAVGTYSARIFPFRVAQLRDARARGGKLARCQVHANLRSLMRSDLSSAIACRVAASGRAAREYAAIFASVSASHCVVATSTSLADRDAVTVFHPLVQARRAASFRRFGIVMRFCSSTVRIILATKTPSAMHASTAMIRHQTANLFTFVS
jgi:hypothetical protein